jgi:GTP-binding protein
MRTTILAVAIIGRPNVGKSTLFNRLAGKRLALVDDRPGLTRDRREAETKIGATPIRLIDTAGLEEAPAGSIAARMRQQSDRAVAEADLILFVIDARAGITPIDAAFAAEVREAGKPVIVVANKAESSAADPGIYEAFSLGLGEPIAVSAEHGHGFGELLGAIAEQLAALQEDGAAESEAEAPLEPGAPGRALKLAVAGRPNAGKSTLVNALIGEERVITGPEAGLTRDTVAVDLDWRGKKVRLYDTAGLRRKSRIVERPESLAAGDALRAIRFAEVVILLIDAENPFEKQDLVLADLVEREGRGLVMAVNKWDLVAEPQRRLKELRSTAERLLPQLAGAPLIPISALSGHGLDKLMAAAFKVYDAWNSRVPTASLNQWLADALSRHQPPAVSGRRIKLRYVTQANARPPTFVLFSSRADALPNSYLRFLVNDLKQTFNLQASPVRLHARKPKNPYAGAEGNAR